MLLVIAVYSYSLEKVLLLETLRLSSWSREHPDAIVYVHCHKGLWILNNLNICSCPCKSNKTFSAEVFCCGGSSRTDLHEFVVNFLDLTLHLSTGLVATVFFLEILILHRKLSNTEMPMLLMRSKRRHWHAEESSLEVSICKCFPFGKFEGLFLDQKRATFS